MSSSVRRGLDALADATQAAIIILADQPGLSTALLERLVERHAGTEALIVAPWYAGRFRNPVLFDCRLFAELRQQTGDRGGRLLLRKYHEEIAAVRPSDLSEVIDVDTWDEYQDWISNH